MEKRLPCGYVAFLIVTLLLIAGAKTEAQVSIKALTLGAVYQSAQERVADVSAPAFPPRAAITPPAQPASAPTNNTPQPREIGGPKGLEPTRYGDWERAGRCIDF